MSVEERIAGLINASALSLQEFARWADLDEARLMNALAGKRRFTMLDLAKITEFCRVTGRGSHVTVEWLATGTQPPKWIRRSQDMRWRVCPAARRRRRGPR